MTRIRHYFLAIRPKTLGISVAPVVVGTSLAIAEQQSINWLVACSALLAALLIQIGTNLHNDAADYERGADTSERLGPARAAAEGWFTPYQIKRAALVSFLSAFVLGIYLTTVGGLPILLLGLAALASGYAYTGGPKPIAYSATGELFVFIFFGLAAVTGSYYLQTMQLSTGAIYSGAALGLLASAVLLVNNYRDQETDRKANKLTLVHYLGNTWAKFLYGMFLLPPFLLPLALNTRGKWTWSVLILLPAALLLLRSFVKEKPGPVFNLYLANTARLQLGYAVLIGAGLLLG